MILEDSVAYPNAYRRPPLTLRQAKILAEIAISDLALWAAVRRSAHTALVK